VDHGIWGLTLKREVRPFEIITFVTNLLIAFFIQRFFTTQLNDLRAEKNLLISGCSDLIRLLGEMRTMLDPLYGRQTVDEKNVEVVLVAFRRLANAITDLEDTIGLSSFNSLHVQLPPLWDDYYLLKRTATGAPFPSTGYPNEQRPLQDRLIAALTGRCRTLVFTINRSTT